MNAANSNPITLLERVLDQTASIVAAVGSEQRALPTPCPGWDVQALVHHLVGQDLRNFTAAARGEKVDWQAPGDDIGEDWSGEFRGGAQGLISEWRAAEIGPPLSNSLDQQIAEFAMHSWDVARATGQQRELDPAVATHSLNWSKQMLRPEYRGPNMPFGVEVPIPEDAPIYDQLAGWFGRDPAWRPGNS
jgi:uncharacterized protein (TIGR03086 family)